MVSYCLKRTSLVRSITKFSDRTDSAYNKLTSITQIKFNNLAYRQFRNLLYASRILLLFITKKNFLNLLKIKKRVEKFKYGNSIEKMLTINLLNLKPS